MISPVVTIILTTYNRAHLIGETLDSIIAQTYKNWNCIIIDDNSKDNTTEVVNKYLKKDNRFIYLVKKNKYSKGLSASRNMGMDLIKETDYIQFFDDDDIMHPEKLEIQITQFLEYSDLDLTIFPTVNFKHGKNVIIKPIGKAYKSNIIDNIGEDFILIKRIFTAQVPLIKWSYIKDTRFNEELFYAEEWEVFSKLFFTKKTKATYVDVPLFFHRKHELSITANLYGKTDIKEISNNLAFLNVYNEIKKSPLFNGKIFSRFITFAVNNKLDTILLNTIEKDLKNRLFNSKIKNNLILVLIPFVQINKKIITKIIHRIARW